MPSTSEDVYEKLVVGCHAYRSDYPTSYDYIPSKGAGVVFCLLFGITFVAHVVQFTWKKTWWCSVFAIGSAGMDSSLNFAFVSSDADQQTVEVLGWAGRTWNADCPYNSTAFMIQISTLIIGKLAILW